MDPDPIFFFSGRSAPFGSTALAIRLLENLDLNNQLEFTANIRKEIFLFLPSSTDIVDIMCSFLAVQKIGSVIKKNIRINQNIF